MQDLTPLKNLASEAVATDGDKSEVIDVEMSVGTASIKTYSRLSYTMWHALAEFIDNSTQSRANYDYMIDDVLKQEGTPLVVEITHNKMLKTLTIEDNSIGMPLERLKEALQSPFRQRTARVGRSTA